MNNYTIQNAGQNTYNKPTGGFPPIYICPKTSTGEDIKDDELRRREYSSHKSAVSIKNIMEKRRDVVPFISL